MEDEEIKASEFRLTGRSNLEKIFDLKKTLNLHLNPNLHHG